MKIKRDYLQSTDLNHNHLKLGRAQRLRSGLLRGSSRDKVSILIIILKSEDMNFQAKQ
jgi:hypothetical protein